VRGEQVADLVVEPALVPGLDRDPHRGRERAQGLVQRRRVGLQGRRELEQHRAELAAEPAGALQQAADRLLGVAQAPDVGEVAAGLDRHHEVGRGAVRPALEGRRLGQPVEGVVGLDGGEPVGVVLQPAGLGEPVRVEPAAPVPVLPARRPDQHGHRALLK
jgi:hypothetical protein